jgi:ubiquinone/menaquinone biosynthesis C-methylase UbiE
METAISTVNWQSYAQKYDMLLDYNPFYQDLRNLVFSKIESWNFDSEDTIADIGAGTGNYSVKLAEIFPEAKVYHVDKNDGMCELAEHKMTQKNLHNLQILKKSVEDLDFPESSLSACFCLHSLYTFPEPEKIIQRIYHWMKPGAVGVFVDPGRTVNVLDWQIAIGWHMVRKYGLGKTLKILREGKEISYQNRQISKLHAQGIYWKHSHQEFCDAVKAAGFEITEATTCFRGISDLVVIRK